MDSVPATSPAGGRAPSVLSAPAPPLAEKVARQRRILAVQEAVTRNSTLESTEGVTEKNVPIDAPVPRPDDVFARIDALMKNMPPGEVGDPAAFRGALETLYRYGTPALSKIAKIGGEKDVTPDESGALEAVIIADGSRPSFLLKDGFAPAVHPFLGGWANDVFDTRHALQKVAKAVGRVQPASGSASLFIGTASLVDRTERLALTNYHVVDDARREFGVAMTQTDRTIKVDGVLEVDFEGEAEGAATNWFKVVEVALPLGYGRGFGFVDAAVLRLEPVDAGSVLPADLVTFSGVEKYTTAAPIPSLCTIGFPGPPPGRTGKTGNVDWDFVVSVLFANKFGYKRLAPGRVTLPLGSRAQDTPKIVFGHDATTFGGASGSPILAWKDGGPPAFGLHFAGVTETANDAISAAKAADALRSIGVPIA